MREKNMYKPMVDLEPLCLSCQSWLCWAVDVKSLQHTWHHRGDKKTGDRRHLSLCRGRLTLVIAEERERAAIGSSISPWLRLIASNGAALKDVVDCAIPFR